LYTCETHFCTIINLLLLAVTKFARETGDIQTLSDVDIKIIALAYMLEAEIHGSSHLREHPPPLLEVNVRKLSEAPLPGWGSNVPNLKEWEELDQMSEAGGDINSRILPLKDIENQDLPMSETNSVCEAQEDTEDQPSEKQAQTNVQMRRFHSHQLYVQMRVQYSRNKLKQICSCSFLREATSPA
jgi:hypothetical protein